MNVSIRNRHGRKSEALENHARKRVAFTLDRFEGRIRSVSLRYEREAGPGSEKRCIVEATGQFGPAVASATGENYFVATNRALMTLERLVGKSLDRLHS